MLTATACALALLLGLAAPDTQALGLGRPQVLSTLGKPLDVSVPLSLADGEQLTEACARAEVSAGDARVPAGLLQLRIEGVPGQQRIRLQSLVRIDEPALRITLALGCPLRLTREFNAFVDPPAGSTAAPV
ncbi:MAG: FimV family protein, partial [Roseateles sp.]